MSLFGVALLVACGSAGTPTSPPGTGTQDPAPSDSRPLVGDQNGVTTDPNNPTAGKGNGNAGSGNGGGSCSASDSCAGCDQTDCTATCGCEGQVFGNAVGDACKSVCSPSN